MSVFEYSDIALSIFSYLELSDLRNCQLVCKNFHKIISDNIETAYRHLKVQIYSDMFTDNLSENQQQEVILLVREMSIGDLIKLRQFKKDSNCEIIHKSFNPILLETFNNQLPYIAPEIKHLSTLRKLIISNSNVQNIPSEIYELINLRELDLGFNRISYISSEINKLVNLKSLYLGPNQISVVPDLSGLIKLRTLLLPTNKLSKIGLLPKSLTRISLNDNKFEEIPSEIISLSELENLSMSNNRIKSIPDINQMKRLRYLDLSHNHIDILPESLANTVSLIEINILENR